MTTLGPTHKIIVGFTTRLNDRFRDTYLYDACPAGTNYLLCATDRYNSRPVWEFCAARQPQSRP